MKNKETRLRYFKFFKGPQNVVEKRVFLMFSRNDIFFENSNALFNRPQDFVENTKQNKTAIFFIF